ncbi:hypothetical protein GUITHDRAFT_132519 [Guillardia theta CCMP2712]|uniref:Uncharacterized protein n=2 Tax=Guillardia theta TaxID=55529 RepID=L1K0N6_GUITC|nr:hypothetical protein GUITHDRAFT_132519 [Guillardia theta CCMP2712]EKX54124.1 hypothetical protein GUITHDRAFT_132519 [Guillardia theta CCMP2712]|eukprot:XP_005841104.1 hypothetical protein GUITHDRAFT_132519 [Guillardia theta CCMP2712]
MRSALKEAAEAAKEEAARRVAAVLREVGYQARDEEDEDGDDAEDFDQDLEEEDHVVEWNYKGSPPSHWDLRTWLHEEVRLETEINKFFGRFIQEKRYSSGSGETGPVKRLEMGGLTEHDVRRLFESALPVLVSKVCDAVRDLMEDPSPSDTTPSSKCFLDASILTSKRRHEINFWQGDSSLQLAAMQAEHCFSLDSDMLLRFEHDNMLLSSTPREEWEIVAGPHALNFDGTFDLSSVPPQEGGSGQGRKGRSVISIKDLMETSIVDLSDGSSLSEEEVVALRLWTGPMHIKYNAALTGEPHEVAASLLGNSYSTTIQMIKSAMLKLAAHRKLTVERCYVVMESCGELRRIDKTGEEALNEGVHQQGLRLGDPEQALRHGSVSSRGGEGKQAAGENPTNLHGPAGDSWSRRAETILLPPGTFLEFGKQVSIPGRIRFLPILACQLPDTSSYEEAKPPLLVAGKMLEESLRQELYLLGKCSLDLKGKLVEEGEKKLEEAILDNSVKSLEEEEELQSGRKLLLFLACLSAHGSLRQLQRTPSEQDLLLHAKFIRFVESNNLREERRRRRGDED